jgi:hypothetical protein
MSDWPKVLMARDLVQMQVLPISETKIKELAREHGIGRMYGRVLGFTARDVQQLHEVLPRPSSSSAVLNRPTGSSVAPPGESALRKALELVTSEQPKPSASAIYSMAARSGLRRTLFAISAGLPSTRNACER